MLMKVYEVCHTSGLVSLYRVNSIGVVETSGTIRYSNQMYKGSWHPASYVPVDAEFIGNYEF